jgi:hypothetical protein
MDPPTAIETADANSDPSNAIEITRAANYTPGLRNVI